jgi:hypothetical protein
MALSLSQFARMRLASAIGFNIVAIAAFTSAAHAQQRSDCLAAHADAQMLRKRGSLMAAHEKLLVCAQEGCPALVANDCATWISEIEASLSSVVFAVSDELGQDVVDARVFANGKLISERADGRAVSIDPGTYTFRFEAPPRAAVEETVSIRQSEKNRIVRVEFGALDSDKPGQMALPEFTQAPELPKASKRGGIPIGTWVLGGVALAGAGAFTTFALLGHGKYEDGKKCRTNARCKNLDELIDSGKRDYVVANIALGAAVASAGAAIIVYLVDSGSAPKKPSPNALQIEPDLASRGALLRYTASF